MKHTCLSTRDDFLPHPVKLGGGHARQGGRRGQTDGWVRALLVDALTAQHVRR